MLISCENFKRQYWHMCRHIPKFFNESLNSCNFQSLLKLANVTPVFKKGYRSSKENYHPTSTLSVISQIFEKYFVLNIAFPDVNLSKYQCRFWAGYRADKLSDAVENKKVFAVLLTNVSKAFNCLKQIVYCQTKRLWF